jgi:hypothetical protein
MEKHHSSHPLTKKTCCGRKGKTVTLEVHKEKYFFSSNLNGDRCVE